MRENEGYFRSTRLELLKRDEVTKAVAKAARESLVVGES